MNSITKSDSFPIDVVVPVAEPLPVGVLEWVVTPTRIYGVDSVGQVFVFKTPGSTPQHRATRRAGRLRQLLAWVSQGPVFS